MAAACAIAGLAAVALMVAWLQRGAAPPSLRSAVTATTRREGSRRARRDRLPNSGLPSRTRARAVAVPILMYHVIAAPNLNAPFPGLYVPPAEFAAQMHALVSAGYHGVTLDRLRADWQAGKPLPPRPIVISFDNGYRTQFTQALPVLRRIGWVGDENLQLQGLPPKQGGLSTAQVRRLVAAGWELDTQGFSHADLITLDAAQLRYQVAGARRVIRARYHVAADWFCYPSGRYNPTVIAAVKAAAYVGATTVVPGWAESGQDPFRLPRLRVLGGTTPHELLNLIADSRHAAVLPASYPSLG
jgi:peptidoglycan/xylan/chitin deacetylase (PgdA/CDA1 family)